MKLSLAPNDIGHVDGRIPLDKTPKFTSRWTIGLTLTPKFCINLPNLQFSSHISLR